MTFTSLTFFLFLALVFSAYWALRSRRLQNILLVIASFCFYGWWDYRFAGLLFGASIIDYGIAIGLSRIDQPGPRRWLLASGITVNLSLLSFFKYFNFFADSAVTLPNTVRKGGCDKWIFSVCSIPNQIGMTPSSSHYSSEQTTSAA
jgi:alginate O-acetyltransferase complex protein AlgI